MFHLTDKYRVLLFFAGCFVVRAGFAGVAAYVGYEHIDYLWTVGIPFVVMAVFFLFKFVRSVHSKKLGFFGGEVWWKDMRLLHAVLYLTFALQAFVGQRDAWIVLAVDVLLGAMVLSNHYFFVTKKKLV